MKDISHGEPDYLLRLAAWHLALYGAQLRPSWLTQTSAVRPLKMAVLLLSVHPQPNLRLLRPHYSHD